MVMIIPEEHFFILCYSELLKLVPLTATGPKVYVTTVVTIHSDYYAPLVETMNHMKSLKLKYCLV